MLKTMQNILKTYFLDFSLFFAIFGFFENFIKKVGQKLGSNRCPLFTMLTKQNSSMFCIVSFVKNRKRKWSYYLGRHAPFEEKWSPFTGDLPTHTQSGLFSGATGPHTHTGLLSRATCPHILKVVYFQGRPALTLTLVYFHGRPSLLIGFTWDPIWRSNKNKNRCVARSTWNPI